MTIDDRARDAGRAVLDEARRLDTPDLGRVETRRRVTRMVGAVAAAVVVVVAGIGVLAWVQPGNEPPPIAPTQTTTPDVIPPETVPPDVATSTTVPGTVAPTTIAPTTAPPPAVVGADGWSFVAPAGGDGDPFFDWPMRAVAAGPPRLVAVGVESSDQRGEVTRPAIWLSVDGLSWQRLDSSAVGEHGEINDVVWHDTGFVAVGLAGGNAAVWVSDEGLEWEQVLVPAAREGGFARMDTVVAVAGGVFAAGHEVYVASEDDLAGRSQEFVGEDYDAAVWWSPDGRDWQRIEDPVFGTPGYQPNDGGEFNGRIVGAADARWGVVFAGFASQSNPDWDYPPESTTVWVLREEWERVDLGTDDQVLGVSAANGVAVVHGSTKAEPQADALFYVSNDGVDWVRAGGDLTGVGASDGIQFVRDVAFVPGAGWVAVGTDEKEFDSIGGAAVWIAGTGTPLEWIRVEHDSAVFGDLRISPMQRMSSLTEWNTTVVVIGGLGGTVEMNDGGTMCCQFAPAAWVWDQD